MTSRILISIFVWYARNILRIPHVILKHDGTHQKLDGITFAYDEKYADEVQSLSLTNHRAKI